MSKYYFISPPPASRSDREGVRTAAGGMKVSFVTVCFKTPHLIRNLLKGVEAAKFGFPFEYVLVDNGGDGTADMVRERYPWARVISGHGNVGFGAGNNIGMREAAGEYVMLVNPDLSIFPGEMEKLLAYADAHPDIGFVGPRLLNPNGTVQKNANRFPTPLIPLYRRTALGSTRRGQQAVSWYFMEDADLSRPIDVDGVFGAAILMRRRALDEIGLFDERYWMYFEDIDMCRRAWEKGWRVTYYPDVRIVHYLQRESRVEWPWQALTNRVTRAHIASAVKYFWKYRGQPLPR